MGGTLTLSAKLSVTLSIPPFCSASSYPLSQRSPTQHNPRVRLLKTPEDQKQYLGNAVADTSKAGVCDYYLDQRSHSFICLPPYLAR